MLVMVTPTSCAWRLRQVTPTTETCSTPSCFSLRCSFSSQRSIKYAVLGAGFAGLSVAWNLLRHSSKESHICVDIYDEAGVGGGASGVAGGLLHPYSPKVKLLWHGDECWKESLSLLTVAEGALLKASEKGILENHEICSCAIIKNRIETINADVARELVPNLSVPSNVAFYMPEALNVNAQSYLQGLFLACKSLATNSSAAGLMYREFRLHKKSVHSLLELSDDYDAVIICFGAQIAFLPELKQKLPLRTCRGVIAQMQLDDFLGEGYPDHSPSILSDAWLAVRGTHLIDLGSTWVWNSANYSRYVSIDESSEAIKELLPKASSVYPNIERWSMTRAVGGLRAMPPVQADGSLPLLGCVDELVSMNESYKKYWLFTGLGARGLFFHGLLGKLLAEAVIARDENMLPNELTSWKHRIRLR